MILLLLVTAISFWTGQSGGFDFKWTQQDITVSPATAPTKVLYSAKNLFNKTYEGDVCGDGDRSALSADQKLEVLSIVGPIMSIDSGDYSFCKGNAHPNTYEKYAAVDFRHPEKAAQLSDYFEAPVLLKALLSDRLIQKNIKAFNLSTPKTLTDLVNGLSKDPTLWACEYGFTKDMLSRFAFHHIEGNKVAVRIGLSNGQEPCRGQLTQLGLLLPIPTALRDDLTNAQARQSGFLTQNSPKPTRDAATSLSITIPAKP